MRAIGWAIKVMAAKADVRSDAIIAVSDVGSIKDLELSGFWRDMAGHI